MERKVKRIFLLYWDKKTMAAVLIKSSVYAGFKMSWSMVYSHSYRFFKKKKRRTALYIHRKIYEKHCPAHNLKKLKTPIL